MKNILDLNKNEIRKFLLKKESYINFSLPSYFDFDKIIKKISNIHIDFQIISKAKQQENLNHVIYDIKSNRYSWRRYQIINPLIYILFVNVISQDWELIKNKITDNIKKTQDIISCKSIPILKRSYRTQKAEQIMFWLDEVEEKSISFFVKYNFIFHCDISNFYDSIYTHTIPWAIHGKKIAKKKRNNDMIGNKLDKLLQAMNYGQTNGIPTGSTLMDLIAEILLTHIDTLIFEKITNEKIKDVYVLRYRDDYRIFSKEYNHGEKILKFLNDILIDYNLKLNTEKVIISSDVISQSLRKDKIDFLKMNINEINNQNFKKMVLILNDFVKEYPDSGSILSLLNKIHKYLERRKKSLQERDIEFLIALFTDIALQNAKTYPLISGILSILISKIKSIDIKKEIFADIYKKIVSLPNTGFLEIWTQHIFLDIQEKYEEKLCKCVNDVIDNKKLPDDFLFNLKWFNTKNSKVIKNTICQNIIDKKILNEKLKKPIIRNDEVNIFEYIY